jgi:hypothetical protein
MDAEGGLAWLVADAMSPAMAIQGVHDRGARNMVLLPPEEAGGSPRSR